MRRFMTAVSVVAGLAVVAAPAVAQGGHQRGERPGFARGAGVGAGAMVRNPATAVLQHRAELELTADQVRQIEAIQARVERENAPRLEQLRAAIGERRSERQGERMTAEQRRERLAAMTQEERAAMRARMREQRQAVTPEEREAFRARMQEQRQALAPVRQAVRETNRAAGQEIRAILTDEQQSKLRETMRRGRGSGR